MMNRFQKALPTIHFISVYHVVVALQDLIFRALKSFNVTGEESVDAEMENADTSIAWPPDHLCLSRVLVAATDAPVSNETSEPTSRTPPPKQNEGEIWGFIAGGSSGYLIGFDRNPEDIKNLDQ